MHDDHGSSRPHLVTVSARARFHTATALAPLHACKIGNTPRIVCIATTLLSAVAVNDYFAASRLECPLTGRGTPNSYELRWPPRPTRSAHTPAGGRLTLSNRRIAWRRRPFVQRRASLAFWSKYRAPVAPLRSVNRVRGSRSAATVRDQRAARAPRRRASGPCTESYPPNEVFFSHARLHGGPAPVRQFLPELINRNWRREIDPRQGARPRTAARGGGRGIPGHGASKVLLRA